MDDHKGMMHKISPFFIRYFRTCTIKIPREGGADLVSKNEENTVCDLFCDDDGDHFFDVKGKPSEEKRSSDVIRLTARSIHP